MCGFQALSSLVLVLLCSGSGGGQCCWRGNCVARATTHASMYDQLKSWLPLKQPTLQRCTDQQWLVGWDKTGWCWPLGSIVSMFHRYHLGLGWQPWEEGTHGCQVSGYIDGRSVVCHKGVSPSSWRVSAERLAAVPKHLGQTTPLVCPQGSTWWHSPLSQGIITCCTYLYFVFCTGTQTLLQILLVLWCSWRS